MKKKVDKSFAGSVARVASTRAAFVRAVRAHAKWLAKLGVKDKGYVRKTMLSMRVYK